MSDLSNYVVELARLTARDSRAAARQVMAIGAALPVQVLWMALVLAAVLSSIMTQMSVFLMPGAGVGAGIFANPLEMAAVQLGLMLGFVWAMVTVGRWRGGHGTWPQALSLMIWLQVLLLLAQAAQLGALLIFAPLADMIGIVTLGLFFVLLTMFVTELHGFQSPGIVFIGILGTLFGMAFALSIVFVILGIGPDV